MLNENLSHHEGMHPDMASFGRRDLLADNHSIKSFEARKIWGIATELGQSIVVDACSDPREGALFTYLPSHPFFRIIRSVAAASPIEDLIYIVTHTSDPIVVAPHFGISSVRPGSRPGKCGGADAKAAFENGTLPKDAREIIKYLTYIDSPDVVIQSCLRASKISALAPQNKMVMAAIVDHETALMIPVAVFQNQGRSIPLLGQPLHELLDPSVLYKIGLPSPLISKEIPSEFSPILNYFQRLHQFVGKDPDFKSEQMTNNPEMVLVTTKAMPEALRYPKHFAGKTNKAFVVVLPYIKVNIGKDRYITAHPQAVENALRQAWYAIHHAAIAQEGHAFSKTKKLMIETGDIELSRLIADEFVRQTWMQPWLEVGGQIYIAEVKAQKETDPTTGEIVKVPGFVTVIDEYKAA